MNITDMRIEKALEEVGERIALLIRELIEEIGRGGVGSSCRLSEVALRGDIALNGGGGTPQKLETK